MANTNTKNNSQQLRRLKNEVSLQGKLTEVTSNYGTTKAGIPYVSVKGVIQIGEHAADTKNFDIFAQEYSVRDGERKESKLYVNTVNWLNQHKNNTVASVGYDNADVVKIGGSLYVNDYVSKDGKLKSPVLIRGSFFNTPAPDKDGRMNLGEATVEGYIKNIRTEVRNEKETGRLIVTLLTDTFVGEIVPVDIVVPEEIASAFEDMYEVGQTASFYIDFIPHKTTEAPKKGGFGVQRTSERTYIETVMVGGDAPLDEDDENAISKEVIKIALADRQAKLDELADNGYQGTGFKEVSSSKPKTNTKSTTTAAVDEDEDIPW